MRTDRESRLREEDDMNADRRDRWLMFVILSVILIWVGSQMSYATGDATLANDVHWMKVWLQSGGKKDADDVRK